MYHSQNIKTEHQGNIKGKECTGKTARKVRTNKRRYKDNSRKGEGLHVPLKLIVNIRQQAFVPVQCKGLSADMASF